MQLLEFSKDNPFLRKKHPSGVENAAETMASTFWTKHEDSLTHLRELTQEQRCKDPRLSHILKAARHGTMDHETYCFMHGLPTRHTGSWMPTNDDIDDVLCKQVSCRALTAQWDKCFKPASAGAAMDKLHRMTWEGRRSQECDVFTRHRCMRCRNLGCSDPSPDINEPRFDDAPCIHQ